MISRSQSAIMDLFQRGNGNPPSAREPQENIFLKPLDKSHPLWYNIITTRERHPLKRERLPLMAKNPLTYADALTNVLALDGLNEDTRATLVALKASIEKKNSADRKPTATQTANENTKAEILAALADGTPRTVTELMAVVPTLNGASNQKASALVRQLVEDGTLKRELVKRKAYFSLAR